MGGQRHFPMHALMLTFKQGNAMHHLTISDVSNV